MAVGAVWCEPVSGASRAGKPLVELGYGRGKATRAMVQLSLGEHDLALNSLEQGIRDRDFRVIYLGIDTTWDPLRESPRFIELLERLGLPQA